MTQNAQGPEQYQFVFFPVFRQICKKRATDMTLIDTG